LVSVIKRPTLDAEDVVKIPIMQGKNTAQHAVSVDQLRSEPTAGRIKNLMDIG
jgi:hypothetical protein